MKKTRVIHWFTILLTSVILVHAMITPSFTLDELYKAKITSQVDKVITLRTKVTWSYGGMAWIPENPPDPKTIKDQDKLITSPLTVAFENYAQYLDDKTQHLRTMKDPGNFTIVSDQITKIKDSNGVEQYALNGIPFTQGKEYFLTGRLKYRMDTSKWSEKAFEEKNNPLYWRQAFEFVLEKIDYKDQ